MADRAPSQALPEPDLQAPRAGEIDDADDLRSFHFRRYMGRTLTRVLLALGAAAGAVGGAIAAGPVVAALAAAGMLGLGVLIVFGVADQASEDSFFDLYANQRGLTRIEDASLPPLTPLLRKGDEREADEVLRGPLGEGLAGSLALYTYTDVYHDKNGRHETDYHFTVALTELPECVEFVPELYCNRKSGFRFMEKVEDAFRTKQRVRLESQAFADEYEVFVDDGQDMNWIRQLFSPSFIVWLSETAPDKFAFELESGVLCCNVKGHRKDSVQLDGLRAATAAVARRVREEVGE